MSAQLREASSVILLRRATSGFEVFLLRRHKAAKFMASAFVFPGGAAEPGEDARTAGVRELFEEAGILLATLSNESSETIDFDLNVDDLRRRILDGADAVTTLAASGLVWSPEPLVPWSHWITPSIESKRFSARFFACELPAGQTPRFDAIETVDEVWVKPADAIARAGELALPPPQVRTFWELSQYGSIDEVMEAGRLRAEEPHPIMPRLGSTTGAPCLLLPWDPEYVETGTGDSAPMAYRPTWACGPSRFVMEDRTWKHVSAPGSTPAGS